MDSNSFKIQGNNLISTLPRLRLKSNLISTSPKLRLEKAGDL